MDIPKNSSAAIIVRRQWVNLQAVRWLFALEGTQSPLQEETGHLIVAKMLDARDPHGVWVEMPELESPKRARWTLLIPWREIIAIAISETYNPEMWKATPIGFSH
jgi:hypothetical protein